MLAGRDKCQNVLLICQLRPRRRLGRTADEPSGPVRAQTGTLCPNEFVIAAVADIYRCCWVNAQPN
jgi:hypothetical protein